MSEVITEADLSPHSESAPPTTAMFSTCDSVLPSGSEENSHVKAKATPSGTKFVQFNVSHDVAQAHGRLGSLIEEASDEDDDVVSVSSNEVTIADNPVIVAETEFQQEPQSSSFAATHQPL